MYKKKKSQKEIAIIAGGINVENNSNKPIRATQNIVSIKILSPNAELPKQAKKGDIGHDLVATSRKIINPFKIKYGFGIALQANDRNYGFYIHPRSSIHKTYMTLSNSTGIIDAGYVGEIQGVYYCSLITWIPYFENGKFHWNRLYKVGERIAQLELHRVNPIEFNVVQELKTTDRGSGGYGSTNKK